MHHVGGQRVDRPMSDMLITYTPYAALAVIVTIANILGARKFGRTWKRQGTNPRLE